MLALINDTGMLVVLVAVILLFGASRLPKLARSLGEASQELKKAHGDAVPTDTSPADSSSADRRPPSPALPAASDSHVPVETVTVTRAQLQAFLAEAGAGSEQRA